ncbi:MAG TPA: alpha-glucan family phosphorylase [Polyangia bacterium]|jgi:starch phosphorylase
MRILRPFTVVPSLPDKLKGLRRLAYNIWWAWNPEATDLFRRLDRTLWEQTGHNPVLLLGSIAQEKLERFAGDEGFRSQLERVLERFDEYLTGPNWFTRTHPDQGGVRIAYFSAEFALTECLAIYSGGLGVLSGDHLKSASDLGVPLCGVGLLYKEGYFRQYLNADGWQQEQYPINDRHNLPIELRRTPDGVPVRVAVDLPGRRIVAQVWEVKVGRVKLYLLDTNVDDNTPQDRDITAQLYGGDLETRMQQEILLGIGGTRALHALGVDPSLCHMNEGHSAFLGLERARLVMESEHLKFDEALEATATGNAFTTHTPVPAGNDRFPADIMWKYFSEYHRAFGITWDDFLALGRENPSNHNEPFCMTVLALKCSDNANAVSKLHGQVSRKMWQNVWPELPEAEVPITSVTNGIHTPSWISREMSYVLGRYLGDHWTEEMTDPATWSHIDSIPDEELWRTHERRRERLVAYARKRLKGQLERRGAPPAEVGMADEVLDPEALTIGFSRRFATYKRGTLLFHRLDRLHALLNDKNRPVQLILAGKAHPRDDAGKELIRRLIHWARDPQFRRRVVFLEDYNMAVARALVQGCDIWLNTPRRPLEASGTSGMKAAANGCIHVSVLDGWWCEGYAPTTGWAIGRGEEYTDSAYQDEVESAALYDLLEKEIVPLFYERARDGLPRGWIARMKSSMKAICPVFNTHRMVAEYTERFYLTGAARAARLVANRMERARVLARWKEMVRGEWPELSVVKVESNLTGEASVGTSFEVTAVVRLGKLTPKDVSVQLYTGELDEKGQIDGGVALPMQHVDGGPDGHRFRGEIRCQSSGLHAYAVRFLPAHEDLSHPFELNLIRWG